MKTTPSGGGGDKDTGWGAEGTCKATLLGLAVAGTRRDQGGTQRGLSPWWMQLHSICMSFPFISVNRAHSSHANLHTFLTNIYIQGGREGTTTISNCSQLYKYSLYLIENISNCKQSIENIYRKFKIQHQRSPPLLTKVSIYLQGGREGRKEGRNCLFPIVGRV